MLYVYSSVRKCFSFYLVMYDKKSKKFGSSQDMKTVLLIYPSGFIIFTLIFLSFFHIPFLSSQTILFYRGLTLLTFTILICLSIVLIIHFKFFKLHIESLLAAVLISAAIHLSLFVVFPVTFDRSVTMYLLSVLEENKHDQSCKGLTRSRLEQRLINEYIVKKKAVDRRIKEQKLIDFVNDKEKCIQLTERGSNFLNFARLIKKIYSLE